LLDLPLLFYSLVEVNPHGRTFFVDFYHVVVRLTIIHYPRLNQSAFAIVPYSHYSDEIKLWTYYDVTIFQIYSRHSLILLGELVPVGFHEVVELLSGFLEAKLAVTNPGFSHCFERAFRVDVNEIVMTEIIFGEGTMWTRKELIAEATTTAPQQSTEDVFSIPRV